ncbi:MAG TPA: hypothetical protein VGL86_29060 [Polyangia bacterium]
MKRAFLAALAALALAASGACSNDLPAASLIDKLRVLAVRAEPPEVAPGETTALDFLAVEPPLPHNDGGITPSPLSAVWLACALPSGSLTVAPCGIGSGMTASTMPPSCADQPSAPLCLIGTDATASYTADVNALAGGAASAELLLTVAVADTPDGAAACLLDIANNDGIPTSPDHCVISIKRLDISDPAQRAIPPNANPTIAQYYATTPSGFGITLDAPGGTWQYAPGDELAWWDIAAIRSDDASERKSDGTYEALTVSWFATAGSIDGDRSLYLPPGCNDPEKCADQVPEDGADTTWFSPTQSEAAGFVDGSGAVDFWAVIRDDRGGVGWSAGGLTLAP